MKAVNNTDVTALPESKIKYCHLIKNKYFGDYTEILPKCTLHCPTVIF